MPQPDFKHRYYLFSFDDYYPAGGLGDVVSTSDELVSIVLEAMDAYGVHRYVWDRVQAAEVWTR